MSADETMALTGVFMDRIAELERAAETSRTAHAAVVAEFAEETLAHELTREAVKAAVDEWNGVSAALGLATARIRELEGERDELLGLAKTGWSSAHSLAVAYGGPSTEKAATAALAIVARIEKAAKGAR